MSGEHRFRDEGMKKGAERESEKERGEHAAESA